MAPAGAPDARRERIELVERLIDSLDDSEVELSPEELAQLDEAIADADRAVERGELIPADEVLANVADLVAARVCGRAGNDD